MKKARDFFRAFFLVPQPRQIRALSSSEARLRRQKARMETTVERIVIMPPTVTAMSRKSLASLGLSEF